MKCTAFVVVGTIGLLVVSLWDRFSYPEMTETQLFLLRWPWYVGAFVAFGVLGWKAEDL